MNDLISRKALIAEYDRVHVGPPGGARKLIEDAPAVDAVEVVHGKWKLEVRSFYRDTWDGSCELAVYILASCSVCNRKHPDNNQVFSKTLYGPEDADDDFRFDQKAEQEKALAEFMQRGYDFSNYCSNCGAKMDGGN